MTTTFPEQLYNMKGLLYAMLLTNGFLQGF